MNALITAFASRPRPVISFLLLLIIAGAISYFDIPKEAEPDITIPQMYVNVIHEGISPEDAETMLIRPLETQLRTLSGLKEIRATASEGSGVLILEFEAGFDSDQALADVRAKVDLARPELPADSEEPFVQEINISEFPILVVMLHGDVPERAMVTIARNLRDKIEGLSGVLDAEVGGDREELLEIIVDPVALETYDLSYSDLVNFVARNNRLVAAGAMDAGQGRFSVKVPGIIEDLDDLLTMPIKVSEQRTVSFQDVATVKRTYKDPDSFARIGGNPAVALEISKRAGSNIIDVVDSVRALVAAEQANWPANLQVTITQDNSTQVRTMLVDLVNNVAFAVILVLIVTLWILGVRSATLVGLSVPGSFLSGIWIIYMMGYSMNIVVLFALIMAVGMLVDGATVVVESAERNMELGYTPKLAYIEAAKRMAWPVISSTATTLAAFLPLLFWPGIVGEFMKYLPITLLVTMAASLAMALLFVPAFGAMVKVKNTGRTIESAAEVDVLEEARDNFAASTGSTKAYLDFLARCLKRPFTSLGVAMTFLALVMGLWSAFGKGVEFFPEIEPEVGQLNIHARGDLAALERDALVREVEARILDMPEFASVYARSGVRMGNDDAEDIIGRIQLQFVDWNQRRPAADIMEDVRQRTADLPGIVVEPEVQESGITSGKPIQIELSASDSALLNKAVNDIRVGMAQLGGFVDITDNRPLPGIDWRIEVDRQEAARFGTDISSIGSAIQLLTNGIKLGDYRPENADDEVDIRVRFPVDERNLSKLDQLTVNTLQGNVPLGNFMERVPAQRVGSLERTDGVRVMKIAADIEEDLLADDKVTELQAWVAAAGNVDPGVSVLFRGENEDQAEAEEFLSRAFGMAIFIIAIILIVQFNSFYQTFLILTAIVFSTIGVFLSLLIAGQPFGIVMCGIGVISLTGVVVSNNIVLIDTYNVLKRKGISAREAIMLTCAQRLRPVFLTALTTILGLIPMTFGININLVDRVVEFGSPSTQWWTQLSIAISGGLTFATALTLVLTPCMLVLGEVWSERRQQRIGVRVTPLP